MSIVVTETPVAVVTRTTTSTEYACDACGARYLIGQLNRPEAINALRPPRSWWRVSAADGSTLWETDRETKHACSLTCLRVIVGELDERR